MRMTTQSLNEKTLVPFSWLVAIAVGAASVMGASIGASFYLSHLADQVQYAQKSADESNEAVTKMNSKLDDAVNYLHSIDSRLSRIEGYEKSRR